MLFRLPKPYRDALAALKEVQRHEQTLMTLDTSAADVDMAREALQQRVATLYKQIDPDTDREVWVAAAHIQRMLATEDDPAKAIQAMTETDLKRRLRDTA